MWVSTEFTSSTPTEREVDSAVAVYWILSCGTSGSLRASSFAERERGEGVQDSS